MHIILGANGHVGSALAQALLEQRESVTVVLHDAQKAGEWQQKGAQFAVADVHDTSALCEIFRQGQRLFILNPPAPPLTDTADEERKSLASILTAIEGSGLKKLVAESTYGAQPGDRIGDLGVLYEMEAALAAQPIPTTIIRAAYYMSNWDMSLKSAQQEGKVHSFYPPDFKLPMVAPHDIGQIAARFMTAPIATTGLHYVEGPELYSINDVALSFAAALKKPVQVQEIPRTQWLPALQEMGFSEPAAASFAAMTALTLQSPEQAPDTPTRGKTSLQQYINDLIGKA